MSGNLSQPDPLGFTKVANSFSTVVDTGVRSINPFIRGSGAYINGDISTTGNFVLPINAAAGVRLADGTLAEPSLSFIADTDTGLYRSGDGQTTFVSNGVAILTTKPNSVELSQQITTNTGNLILNPAGGAIDFSGKALINFSGISTNPNYFDTVAAANVITVGAVSTTLVAISTATNATYTLTGKAACGSLSDMTSSGSFIKVISAKNIGGVVSIGGVISTSRARDTPLNTTADIVFSVSGSNILMEVAGVAGQTIQWFGGVQVVRMLF